MKKKFLTVIIALIIILVGVGLFFLIRYLLTPAAEITKIYDKQMLFPTLNTDQKNIFYFSNLSEAAIYQYNLANGQTNQISEKIDTPDTILWSSQKDRALFQVTYDPLFEKYGSPFANPKLQDEQITFWLYDLNMKKLSLLNENIRDIIWTRDGKRLAYVYYDADLARNIIIISDPDGIKNKTTIDFGYSVKKILYFDEASQNLLFGTSSGDETENKLDIYQSLNRTKANLLIPDVDPSQIFISPDGKQIAYVKEEKLMLFKADSKQNQELMKKITKISPVWLSGSQNVLIFVREKNKRTDRLFKIDTSSDIKVSFRHSRMTIDANNLMIASDNKTLYLTLNDDRLYKIDLPQ